MRIVLLLGIILLTACSNDNSSSAPVSPPEPNVILPVADAGNSMMLQRGATAFLNGSGSYDPEGGSLTYSWVIISAPAGSSSALNGSDTPFPSLFLDVVGDYEIELTVNNGDDDSVPVTVVISDSDSIPVANAGPDQAVQLNMPVTLNGSLSFDSDGDQLSYLWTIVSSPTGSSAQLARANSPFPVLTPDVTGDYEVQLIVNDGTSDSLADTVIISDQNVAPVANAGRDTIYTVGASVSLDGSASSDANGDALSYQWSIVSVPSGSAAVLTNATSVIAEITPDVSGDYIIALRVNDGTDDSMVSTVTLNNSDHIPIANAGANLPGQIGALVHLDGSASMDADGDTLTPRWSIVSKPKSSVAALADVHTFHPTITPDSSGDYVVQLIVYDGQYLSAADTVTISTSNLAPTANAGPSTSTVTGQKINLDGSKSTDPEGSAISYQWSLASAPSGSTSVLSATNVVAPEFTPDVMGDYVFQLIVSDGDLFSSPATVKITDKDLPPVARAGADQSVNTGVLAILDGSTSSDPEQQPLSYEWALLSSPSGSGAVLSDAMNAIASITPDIAGDYVVQLTVTDAAGQKSSDVVVIRDGASNTIPVANAGADQKVDLNANVVLDGSGSSDADGDTLLYSWSMLSRPAGSSAQLLNAQSMNPNFTPDVEGDFVIQLVVGDGKSTSFPSVIVVHDSRRNIAPVALITATTPGITNQLYTLDGSGSSDLDGDPLTYYWALLGPTGSTASLSSTSVVQPTFTPDVSGKYVVALSVGDGVDTSWTVSTVITISDPVKGAAIPVPAGHNLMMLSSVGGDNRTGSLVSLEEKNLSSSTEILSMHGIPKVLVPATIMSPVLNPIDNQIYTLITSTGLNGTGAIIKYDPENNSAELFANTPRLEINGHVTRDFRSRLLFHPDGKSIFTFSMNGGAKDAGVLFHINNDTSSAHFREFTPIAEFGVADGTYLGSSTAPASDLEWNGDGKIIAVFGFSRTEPHKTPIEIRASDVTDLSKPWSINNFGSATYVSGRKIVVENDNILMVSSVSPLIFESVTDQGGIGRTLPDCHISIGSFRWGQDNVYIMCSGGSGFLPGLYKSNTAVESPDYVRRFSNLDKQIVTGVMASSVLDTAYMNTVDEVAGSFIGFDTAALGFNLAKPTLSEIQKSNYVSSPIITGGGDRGTYFVGDPAILDRPSDAINDRFVTILSADGGADGGGALLTYDRLNTNIEQFDFGFDTAGFPFGRITKASTGDYFFSTLAAPVSSQDQTGTALRYDSAVGITEVIQLSKYLRPGIGLVESSSKTLYGLGIEQRRAAYTLYSINPDTLAFNELGDFDATSDYLINYELAIDNDNLWFLTDSKVHCVDSNTGQRGSLNLVAGGPQDPVRAISFASAGGDGFFATRTSSVVGSGTIQRVTNNCAMPVITGSVAGLTDLPSTALLAASDGYFYYGTEGGKLMRFDESTNSVSEVASLANRSIVGFLIEDSNGDVVGFASNGTASEDQVFAYTLLGGAFVQNAVPTDTPIDTIYPGLTEIN